MLTPTQHKRTLQLQRQNPTQTRLNHFTKSPIKLPPISKNSEQLYQNINISKPKRSSYKGNQKITNEKDLPVGKQLVSKIVKGLEKHVEKLSTKDSSKGQKVRKGIINKSKDTSLLSQGINPRNHSNYTNSNNLGEILSFYLCEDSIDRGSQLEQPMKTVYEWENEEVHKFVSDPNLGDYLIKMPNPDDISEEYVKRYSNSKKGNNTNNNNKSSSQQCLISYQQATACYRDMFNTQNQQRARRQRQLSSFTIAYYMLQAQNILERSRLFIIQNYNDQYKWKQTVCEEYFAMADGEMEIFNILFQYYRAIETSTIDDVIVVKKSMQQNLSKALHIYQSITADQSHNKLQPSYIAPINMYVIEHQYYKRVLTNQQHLQRHKSIIMNKFLAPFVHSMLQTLSFEPLGYDYELQQAKNKYFFFTLAKRIRKVSLIFSYFDSYAGKLFIDFVKREFCKYGSMRKLFNGGLLEKRLSGESMIWVNNKNKPKDLFTLLRNCFIYQLTQRCLFRVRTFLSRNQNQLMIIVKASQQVLEYYTQKNEIPMEIQIGATDIFSFEPVDMYNRPLRLHTYLHDEQFIRKYSLKSNKLDKDEQQSESKSIQSEALNIYKKAEKMNPDQLRAKTILDQQDCDDALRWISSKLNCPHISQPNILTNEKNNQQISRQTWQCYYVYNKLIISFVNRIRKLLSAKSESIQNDLFTQQVNNNLGLILRLMFVKAIAMVNDFYYLHRENRSAVPNYISNLYTSKRKLRNIWDQLGTRQPTGYSQYIKNKYFERIWRKYQINENKQRSKFFPAQRLSIANKIISKYININRAIQKQLIIAYFPLHDPFILKGIQIEPYLINLKRKPPQLKDKKQRTQSAQNQVFNIYSLYESKYTASDFTKLSVSEKLSVKNSIFKYFSVETVRYYCGEKIAFYFEFIRFLAKESFGYILPCMLIQIFLWVEENQVLSTGDTNLGYFNDALIFILTILNMFWTTNTVQQWKIQEKNLGERFGVSTLSQKDEKRVSFRGSYKRNFETDDMNYEYVSGWVTWMKMSFGIVVNILYVILVALVIIQIFVLKSVLFQKGFSQSTVNTIPSILIALAVQLFNYLYTFLIKLITTFQNHKTISSFENSLISKSYTITFVVTFFSIFIYAFFSSYLDADYLCIIKTTETKQIIYDCKFFVSSQLLSFVMIDLGLSIVSGIWPFLKFKIRQLLIFMQGNYLKQNKVNDGFKRRQYWQGREQKSRTKFYYNKFESIDQFYEQQDKMYSLMFTPQMDNTWLGYINLINVFTALAMFGPALPFLYVMIFVSSLVRLHASKYEIIYLAKRAIPIKTNSIHLWLNIIEIVSVISIITNIGIYIFINQLAFMIFTRKIFAQNRTEIFFFFLISFLILKFYLLTQYTTRADIMADRNKKKVQQVLFKNLNLHSHTHQQSINTDIINVAYDQNSLKRQLPKIKKAHVVFNRTRKNTRNNLD